MSLRRLLPALLIAGLVGAAPAHAEPVISAPPAIVGAPMVGSQLHADGLQVDAAVSEDSALTWERSAEQGFEQIPDAHEATYAPTIADVGHRLRVHVVVETAMGTAEEWSEPTEAIGYRGASRPLRLGAIAGAPARLSRWIVRAGDAVHLSGQVAAALATAEARLVLQPTVPAYAAVDAPVSIDAMGRVASDIVPTVNAVAWLELAPTGEPTQRIQLGLVGVRPRIVVRLGATADGRDTNGHALVRDLRVLPGSILAPGVAGLQLTWEGRLPGDRSGTAVCRSSERITSGSRGQLRGGCQTRGSWSSARWRLVLDPGTTDPAAAPFLPSASAWTAPIVGQRAPHAVALLPVAAART
ncbi:MAG: hypothetical protein ACR2J9_06450 [Gaiellales bacterium]